MKTVLTILKSLGMNVFPTINVPMEQSSLMELVLLISEMDLDH